MPGRGFAPKQTGRRTRHTPTRGEYQAAVAPGWAHGDVPDPPARLTEAARVAWATWFGSWFAAHWSPADLPTLRLLVKLYAKCDSGRATAAERSEFRQLADSYGITPKGQQDRRWTAPKADAVEPPKTAPSPYAHLGLVVNE